MFFQLKLQEIVNFTKRCFVYMSCLCKRGNTELGEWKAFVPCPGPGHRYQMPPCILDTWPSWSPERGARAVISGRWEHHVLFVSIEGKPTLTFLLSWVQREKDRRVLERDSFFFLKKHYLFLCACMWEAVGMHMHVWSHKRASDAGDGVRGDYDLPSVNGRNWTLSSL